MNISENVKYIGVNDHKLDLFEGQYAVPKGMSIIHIKLERKWQK